MPIVNNLSKKIRVTSTNAIVNAIHAQTGVAKADVRDVVHAWNHFIADCLSTGYGVNLYGVGTLFHRFRKGRGREGKNLQPDTLIAKFSAVPKIRKNLVKLCEKWKDTPEFQEALKRQRISPIAKFHAKGFVALERSEVPPMPYQQQIDEAMRKRKEKLEKMKEGGAA